MLRCFILPPLWVSMLIAGTGVSSDPPRDQERSCCLLTVSFTWNRGPFSESRLSLHTCIWWTVMNADCLIYRSYISIPIWIFTWTSMYMFVYIQFLIWLPNESCCGPLDEMTPRDMYGHGPPVFRPPGRGKEYVVAWREGSVAVGVGVVVGACREWYTCTSAACQEGPEKRKEGANTIITGDAIER
jgi:hypothetical protein